VATRRGTDACTRASPTLTCASPQEGEADIKYAGWVQRLGVPIAADAIDGNVSAATWPASLLIALSPGDFVPLGLLNAGRRSAVMRLMVGGEVGVRANEWVDIDLLREGISIAIFQMSMPPLVPWRDWQLHCLVVLIALTGTDFSRNLPLIKPKKLWAIVPGIMPTLLRCFKAQQETGRPQVDVQKTIDTLVPAIYRGIFPTHVGEAAMHSFDATIAKMRSSRLADRTKQLLPSEGRAACTVQNANFLLQYWTLANPDSMKQGFGFRLEGNNVAWDE
jgi:hypothetical protein